MYKKYRILILFIIIIAASVFLNPGGITIPAEKIFVPSGMGVDLLEGDAGEKKDMVSMNVYTFNEKDKTKSMVISGISTTIPDTRATRQLSSNRKFIAALEKAIIFSEDMSRLGIEDTIDILFANQFMNDMGWLVICKGKAIDILKHKVEDYPSPVDYIQGMIENAKEHNFFSSDYRIMDAYVRLDAEGRNLVLPYIEITDDKLEITGMALFKKNKMVRKIDANETKIMNMLRQNNVRGVLEIQKNLKKYISLYATSKRKVTCQKSDSKYLFTIDLSFKGSVLNNMLYKDFGKNPEAISQLENDIKQQIEKQCKEFIDKMKNEYKVDCLELGRFACAKYGRNSGVDWNEIISNSDINVNVKVTVDGLGRGRYVEIK